MTACQRALRAGQAAALYEMGLDGEASFAAAEGDCSPAQEAAATAAALRPGGRAVLATRLLLSYNPQVHITDVLPLTDVDAVHDGLGISQANVHFHRERAYQCIDGLHIKCPFPLGRHAVHVATSFGHQRGAPHSAAQRAILLQLDSTIFVAQSA